MHRDGVVTGRYTREYYHGIKDCFCRAEVIIPDRLGPAEPVCSAEDTVYQPFT